MTEKENTLCIWKAFVSGKRVISSPAWPNGRYAAAKCPGKMHGCERCGMVLINDRRGTLLVAPGGMGSMHKRIFPCQRPPKCVPVGVDAEAALRAIRSQLAQRNDPRFNLRALS